MMMIKNAQWNNEKPQRRPKTAGVSLFLYDAKLDMRTKDTFIRQSKYTRTTHNAHETTTEIMIVWFAAGIFSSMRLPLQPSNTQCHNQKILRSLTKI